MNLLIIIFGLVTIFVLSLAMTGLIRKYALSRAMIDIPGERSSHSIPTPRGGGAVIIILLLISIVFTYVTGMVSVDIMLALGVGTLIVAIIGWVDDHKHVPALWRAVLYTLAAVWAMYWLESEYSTRIDEDMYSFGLFNSIFIIVGIAWLTNLYNFMDGIDALATIQAICTSLMSGVLFWLEGQQAMTLVCSVISVSSCGFLFWNWPPAKIFMGDVGSCALGFCFGILAVIGEIGSSVPIAVWFILLSVFICDATFTLLIRVVRGEKWYKAHKSHAYQKLVLCGMSHKSISIIVLAINVLVLWPLAWVIYHEKTLTLYIVSFVVVLMFTLWGIIQIYYYRTAGLKIN
jgi:glycosyltransferase WbpL